MSKAKLAKKSVNGIKGKFEEKDLDEYLENVFVGEVVKFNKACGKNIAYTNTAVEAVQMYVDEGKRVFEECRETLVAFEKQDTTERLDGVVDILWTNSQLLTLLEEGGEKYGQEAIVEAIRQFKKDELAFITSALALVPICLDTGRGELFTPKRIKLACELVIENNKQKYTSSKEEALDWEEKNTVEGVYLQTNVVDGETYYCLKRKVDGYVVKPYNFKPVKLELA